MSNADNASYERLRQLAFEDPLEAKREFLEILNGDAARCEEVVRRATQPGESRVRQVIARAVQRHPERSRLTEALRVWKEVETDEFALTAIEDALTWTTGKPRAARRPSELPDVANTFRYLSSRLRHRVLNALPRAALSMDELNDAIEQAAGPHVSAQIRPQLDDLKTSLRRLQQAVSFEVDEAYFTVAPINLPIWLQVFAKSFQAQFGSMDFRFETDSPDKAVVLASPYLLEIVFANLWVNSKQERCLVSHTRIRSAGPGNNVEAFIIDDGPGLSASDKERAFKYQFSTKRGDDRGRGHMEVAEAMHRLRGTVNIKLIDELGYRVVLTFPRSNQ